MIIKTTYKLKSGVIDYGHRKEYIPLKVAEKCLNDLAFKPVVLVDDNQSLNCDLPQEERDAFDSNILSNVIGEVLAEYSYNSGTQEITLELEIRDEYKDIVNEYTELTGFWGVNTDEKPGKHKGEEFAAVQTKKILRAFVVKRKTQSSFELA